MKKLVVVAAIILTVVAGSATVYALQDEPKKVSELSTTVVEQTQENVEPVVEPEPTAPIEPAVVAPKPQVKVETPKPEPVKNPYVENSTEWYAFKRRAEIGKPIPFTSSVRAYLWDDRAKEAGLVFDRIPEVGAVAILACGNMRATLGIVEEVRQDGSILISQVTSPRVIDSSLVSTLCYIH